MTHKQARHILRCLKAVKAKGATQIEVTEKANAAYFKAMKARTGSQVFFRNNCGSANSYYFDKHGDVPFRPATSLEAHWRSMTFPMKHYRIS